jgi:hypothetical protein
MVILATFFDGLLAGIKANKKATDGRLFVRLLWVNAKLSLLAR